MPMRPELEDDWATRREQIIGLGERSARKSYYPELQQKLRELQHAKATLSENNRQMQAILDAASEISIIATDSNGIITTFNRGAEKMLGYRAEEVVGKESPILFHSSQEIAARAEEYSRKLQKQVAGFDVLATQAISGDSECREWTYICKDGTHLLVLLTITVMHRQGEAASGFLGIATNITEQKNLENKLLQSQKMESIGQLAGGLAHDFNNVLTIITGFASLLQLRLKLDDVEQSMFDNIQAAVGKATSLTSSLLTFSRKQGMVKHAHNLNTLIADVGKLLSKLIGEDIQMEMHQTEEALPVFVDGGQIEQVLLNMATNARDAMPLGGVLAIKTTLEMVDETFVLDHGHRQHEKYAVITISDSGKGMDSETIKKIFEPFFTTKPVGKGTGLGLSMAYGIISQHGGLIDVCSEPGVGTTFKIYLPIAQADVSKKSPPNKKRSLPGGNETILIAEDERAVRMLIQTILVDAGYSVILAENGQECVEKFIADKDKIKLVILDMIMPIKSGKLAFEEIKQIQPDIKALFCSGYSPDIIQRQGNMQGNHAFLMKPVQLAELRNKIRELLDN